jgi:hypothetical protein
MRGRLSLLLLALSLLLPGPTAAQEASLAQLQAAYFFNFIKYTSWKEGSSSPRPLRVRILLNEEIARTLKNAPEQSIHDRPLEIRNCRTFEELLDADAAYIPAKAATDIPTNSWKRFGPGTLLVSDWQRALDHGISIQLNYMNEKIRFLISLDDEKSFTISSKLLRLATEVRR